MDDELNAASAVYFTHANVRHAHLARPCLATSALPAARRLFRLSSSNGTPVTALMRKKPPNMYAKVPSTLTQRTR